METLDVAIVGGGIVGLWTAYTLIKEKPNLSIALFEKEQFLGEHSSSRNSEVLHAGLYYDYNSLKHQTCLRGNILWREFCDTHQLSFLDCGKYIVANNQQLTKLDELYSKAEKNKVPGLRTISPSERQELSKNIKVDAGFFSPSSAVLDVSNSIKTLAHLFEQLGGLIFCATTFEIETKQQDGFIFQIINKHSRTKDTMSAHTVINTAGHWAIDLRQQLGLNNYKNKFVKGNYLVLKNKLPLQSLIYPIPPEHGLGLGIHLTLDTAGGQKFGPNTENISTLNYTLNESLIDEMLPAITELFPHVSKEMLSLGYAGVRSKIINANDELQKDFIIGNYQSHGIKNYFELLGIESPGVTAAPALAEIICSQI